MALLVTRERNYFRRPEPKEYDGEIITRAKSFELAEVVLSHCTIPPELNEFFLEYLSARYLIDKKLYKKHFSMYNFKHE